MQEYVNILTKRLAQVKKRGVNKPNDRNNENSAKSYLYIFEKARGDRNQKVNRKRGTSNIFKNRLLDYN